MIVTAWNNGTHSPSGSGYGVKIDARDRDRFFDRNWKSVHLLLEGSPDVIEVNIDKPSFWGTTCRELISAEIGHWFIQNGLAPWPKRNPPKITLEPTTGNNFVLKKRIRGTNAITEN